MAITEDKQRESIMNWKITKLKSCSIKNPLLIEGMPGIGNVGKIAMDVLIDETKAVPILSFFSTNMPNSVFIDENNLVALPKIIIYYKNINKQDYLFLTGDVQPTTEQSSYEFCELVLEILNKYNGKHILTLGGIGLNDIPESPKVYLTGNNKLFVDSMSACFKKKKIVHETKIYGMVGPILGVSGLLLGLAIRHNIKAYSLLAETFGHPIYVGLKGSRAILDIIEKNYCLGLTLKKLDKEIFQIDTMTEKNSDSALKYKRHETNYIG